MARIGVLPTKTSIELREPDGDVGTIPAASEASAGVMTARHVQMLEQVYARLQGGDFASAPMVIERPMDMSQYATKLEVKQLLTTAMPKVLDMTPQIQALRGELMALQSEASGQARQMLAAPTVSTDAVDQTARVVLDNLLAAYEGLDARVRQIEVVMDTLRTIAEVKAQEAA